MHCVYLVLRDRCGAEVDAVSAGVEAICSASEAC